MNTKKEYQEHIDNLERLKIDSYRELVGKEVYYIKPSYGAHKVVRYNEEMNEFILSSDGQIFESSTFKVKLISDNKENYTKEEIESKLNEFTKELSKQNFTKGVGLSESLEFTSKWFKQNF